MADSAVLFPFNAEEVDVRIDQREFMIGRNKSASYDIKDLSISRTHCIFCFNDGWTLCDKSSGGTWLNRKRLNPNENTLIKDGDHIRLGDSKNRTYIFCTGGLQCPNSCHTQRKNSHLDAELAQRRRLFEHRASIQRDGLEKSILETQQDRLKLETEQKLLRENFNDQLRRLEERNRQLHIDLEKKEDSSESNLIKEREELEKLFSLEKKKLEEMHMTETCELAKKISVFEAVESDLKNQNAALLKRLEFEKQQFEIRLEEERLVLERTFAEKLAEQQRLAAEKDEVEEALRLRIQELEKMAHQEVEQQQQRQSEREVEEDRLSKEKKDFEKRLEELQKALEEKERQELEREKEFQERDQELKAQEQLREFERKEREERMEAEFMAKKRELEELERQKQQELDKHKEEVTKELQDREAELKRKAEEHEKELEAQKLKEQELLRKELEEKEQAMRQQLESDMFKLLEEKVAIEMSIRGELSRKEGENAETLQKLQSELDQVKRDLDNTSNKRTLLEKELVEASLAKEAASKSELEARKAVIENFGELVESELQCSICNELFVLATTLNCTHTFCQLCINNWLQKKKDCPICRAKFTQKSRSIVLDNFIDKIVENLSDDLKRRRKDIVEERGVLAHVVGLVDNPNKRRKTNAPQVPANVLPVQLVNHRQVLVPVNGVPAGANVIRIPLTQAQAIATASAHDRNYRFTEQSTSQRTEASQQHRLQPLPQGHQPMGHPSSSAPNQMTTTMSSQQAPMHLQVRYATPGHTNGGGTALRVGPGTYTVMQMPLPPPHNARPVRPVSQNDPRAYYQYPPAAALRYRVPMDVRIPVHPHPYARAPTRAVPPATLRTRAPTAAPRMVVRAPTRK